MTSDFEKLLKEKSFDYTPTVRQRFRVGELPKVMSLPDIRVISVKDLKESKLKVLSERELAELLAKFYHWRNPRDERPFIQDENTGKPYIKEDIKEALRFLKERENKKFEDYFSNNNFDDEDEREMDDDRFEEKKEGGKNEN